MADADRLVAALNYLQEQKPADPLESFRSLAGLRDAYERRVQPIINNARQTFSTGGAMGDLLRSYGEAAALGNAAALQGMGIPFKGPMTAPREEGFSSGENFRPMGDPQQQFAGQLLGDPMNVQPMIAPAARGVVAAGKYAGPELARGLENYMVKSGGILPMDTWHGSPHRFPPTAKNPLGEFDASKIGTGEGAQAYGHGLYLAENPGVAKTYAEDLAKAGGNPLVIRKSGSVFKEGDALTSEILDALKYREMGLKDAGQFPHNTDYYAAKKVQSMPEGPYRDRVMAALDELKGTTSAYEKKTPNLYKVDLPDEQIAKMLDWDKPLNQQPEALKTIRGLVPADMLKTFDANVKSGISGSNAYKNYIPSQSYAIRDAGATNYKPSAAKTFEDALAEVGGDTSRLRVINDHSEAKVSEMLRAQGIPGIRYLDGGSRAAPSSAKFVKADVVGAADDLTALAKSMGLDAEVRHSGSNAGKSSYVSVFDPMTNRYIKSAFRISDHGTGPLRHQDHIHINSPADLAAQKNDLFEWVKRNRTEKGVDTTGLSAPSQGTSNFVVFPGNEGLLKILDRK